MTKNKSTWGRAAGTAVGGVAGAGVGILVAAPTLEADAIITVPIGVAAGAGLGKKYGEGIGVEVDKLVDEAKSLIGKTGAVAERGLKTTKKKMQKVQRKHRKHQDVVDYLWVWMHEIDKRINMGHKEYHRLQKSLHKQIDGRKKQLKRLEEKVL